MQKLTFDSQTIDSILKTVLEKAGFCSKLESSNAMQPRVEDSRTLIVDDTALMQRLSQQNLDYFYNDVNLNCIYIVLNMLFERKDLVSEDIKTIRIVCTMWQEMMDGISFGCNGLLQQRFLVRLTSINQLVTICKKSIPKENNLELECVSRLVLDRKLKIYIALLNDDICSFINKMQYLVIISKYIEMISFEDFSTKDNVEKVQRLLNTVACHEKLHFSGLKKLIFRDVASQFYSLNIPGFQNLETLIFNSIYSLVAIKYCQVLSRMEYKHNAILDIEKLK